MLAEDCADDATTWEPNQLATDDECPESSPMDHEREPGRNDPGDPLLSAIATLNLAWWSLEREPNALDVRVDFILAKIRLDGVVWEMARGK